jgi:hypothetical protein
MTQIVINHDGKLSNAVAINAVAEFIMTNKIDPTYRYKMIVGAGGVLSEVEELPYKDEGMSTCNVVFSIKVVK